MHEVHKSVIAKELRFSHPLMSTIQSFFWKRCVEVLHVLAAIVVFLPQRSNFHHLVTLVSQNLNNGLTRAGTGRG